MNEGADICAYWAKLYNFPIEKIDAAGLRAGKRGFFGHADVSAAWREVDHTDPGANFPWDIFLQKVRARVHPKSTKQEVKPMPDPKLDSVHHELTHRFQSRYKDAAGVQSSFRDTAIGYALENDAKLTRLMDDELPKIMGALDEIKRAVGLEK